MLIFLMLVCCYVLQVICAKKGPFPVEVEAGKTYYWCTCGRSKNQVLGVSVLGNRLLASMQPFTFGTYTSFVPC